MSVTVCVCSVHDHHHAVVDVLGGFVLGIAVAVCVFTRTVTLLPVDSGRDKCLSPVATFVSDSHSHSNGDAMM